MLKLRLIGVRDYRVLEGGAAHRPESSSPMSAYRASGWNVTFRNI